jgi:hypothetical protein
MEEELSREMWRRICDVLDEVLDLPRTDRPGRVRRSCEGSAELQRWVEILLHAADEAGDFLERPPWPEAVGWVRKIAGMPGPGKPPIA